MFNSQLMNLKQTNLNFGPQHPAAHGVLRLALQLNNERIVNCDPHIGLLHRATEFLITTKNNYLSLPYFDRLDYVSMLSQEHAYSINIENINRFFFNNNSIKKYRIIMDEITRILNHLLAIACHALDVGSMSVIFWAFEERENFLEIYENVSGARMHTAFIRPIYFNKTISINILTKLTHLIQSLPVTITEISTILNNNKVWKSRLKNIGLVSAQDVKNYAITGVMARSVGFKSDLRQNRKLTYSFYKNIDFFSFSAKNGDCLDRYNLRMYEIIESSNIINNTVLLSKELTNIKIHKYMEQEIFHFKVWSGFISNKKGHESVYIESPKGWFGTSIIMDKTTTPLKCKIRSPSYNHLFYLKYISKGLLLADLITLIGTIDIVFGEIDR